MQYIKRDERTQTYLYKKFGLNNMPPLLQKLILELENKKKKTGRGKVSFHKTSPRGQYNLGLSDAQEIIRKYFQ